MRLTFFYFSGCGYSEWVVFKAMEIAKAKGHEVAQVIDMEFGELPDQTGPKFDMNTMKSLDTEVVVVSPVYYWGLPSIVVKRLAKIPLAADKNVALWLTNGGYPAYAAAQGVSLLKDRGYVVTNVEEIKLPDTFLPLSSSQRTDHQKAMLMGTAEKRIEQAIAKMPATEKVVVKKKALEYLQMLAYYVCLFAGRHCVGFSFVATSKCTKCRWCVRNCPASCISLKSIRPEWGIGCVGCFRCVNGCPEKAIDMSWLSPVFGVMGAFVCWAVLFFSFSFLGSAFLSLFSLASIPVGYLFGALLFQILSPRMKLEKTCVLKKRKRVFISEKGLR